MSLITRGFLLFLAACCAIYYLVPARWQRWVLLAASVWFAAAAGPWTVGVLTAEILLAWAGGLAVQRAAPRGRGPLLAAGTALLLGALIAFKYSGMQAATFGAALPDTLRAVSVLGISYYTLMAIGYLADVAAGRQEAERSLARVALFLSFFPQLGSGPIGRAVELLPQFDEPHPFVYEDFSRGLTRMLWGYFKKLVIADGLALAVDPVFRDPSRFSGPVLVLAAGMFSYQLYCDFSGYTDIARGAGEVFGIRLRENFARPFAARSFAGLWGRWHMSLSQWFRDYVYFPLGGSRHGTAVMCLATMTVFALSGIWHIAGWIFLAWGLLNGVFNLLDKLTRPARARLARALPGYEGSRAQAVWQRIWVFAIFSFCFILFRVGEEPGATAADCLYYYARLAADWPVLWQPARLVPQLRAMSIGRKLAAYLGGSILLNEGVDWLASRAGLDAAAWLRARRPALRMALYYLLALLILCFGQLGTSSFIYFQFNTAG